MNDEYNQENEKAMAYDLRQIYANIVGKHMNTIYMYRSMQDFYSWYKSLIDLHTVIKHKFTDLENDEKEYNIKIKAVSDLAKKYPQTWRGIKNSAEEVNEVDYALRQVEEFLYQKMEESEMFGTKFKFDLDEI